MPRITLYDELTDVIATARNLTPKEIVAALDQDVVGQAAAKRALALAFRDRFRRAQLPEKIRKETHPKNVMMKGPTGTGKTELARRMAALSQAPFAKVEATHFTQVGYVGRDVKSMVNDLAQAAVKLVTEEMRQRVYSKAVALAENDLYAMLHPSEPKHGAVDFAMLSQLVATHLATVPAPESGPTETLGEEPTEAVSPHEPDSTETPESLEAAAGPGTGRAQDQAAGPEGAATAAPASESAAAAPPSPPAPPPSPLDFFLSLLRDLQPHMGTISAMIGGIFTQVGNTFAGRASNPSGPPLLDDTRAAFRAQLRSGELDEVEVPMAIFVPGSNPFEAFERMMSSMGADTDGSPGELLARITGSQGAKQVKVPEALELLIKQHVDALLDHKAIRAEALERAQEMGIIFIDEVDKIGSTDHSRDNVGREGLQRDLLSIVEGTLVTTSLGPIKTDNILFISSGAFHVGKLEDLIPEFRGRFPILVALEPHTVESLHRILTEPRYSFMEQAIQLLAKDRIHVTFTDDAKMEIAKRAFALNQPSKKGRGAAEETQDTGARRLSTVLSEVLEEISFDVPGEHDEPVHVEITADYVRKRSAATSSSTAKGFPPGFGTGRGVEGSA